MTPPSAFTITRAKDGGYFVIDPATPAQMVSTVLMAGPLAVCLAYVEEAFSPPVLVRPAALSEADLDAIRRAPGGIASALGEAAFVSVAGGARAEETTLEWMGAKNAEARAHTADLAALAEALELYQRGGHRAGVQVVGEREVVAWVGDIQEAMAISLGYSPWAREHPGATTFYRALGADSIAQAAKWLLHSWDPTHG